MRKMIGTVALAALVALSLVSGASATSNYPNGTIVTGTNSGNIALSGIVTCGVSNVSGTLTNNGVGAGIDTSYSTATFSSCNTPVTACNLPWTDHSSSGGPTNWVNVITAICIVLSSLGCQYQGNLTGVTYDETTDLLTLGGTLSKTSGGFLCPSSGTVSGKYLTTPTDLDLS